MTTPGEVVGRESERLTRVPLDGRARCRVDHRAVDLDEDGLEGQVERGRRQAPGEFLRLGQPMGPVTKAPDEALSAATSPALNRKS